MRLIHDCVRDVMLYIEDNLQDNSVIDTTYIQKGLPKYSINDINYTCKKLKEAGYLTSRIYLDGNLLISSMTYDGHMFLDTIRDNDIWKETKSKVSKITSVSLPIIQQVAAQLIALKLGI